MSVLAADGCGPKWIATCKKWAKFLKVFPRTSGKPLKTDYGFTVNGLNPAVIS